ncbi:hypothetical protein HYS47_00800 [Candidatus Woesearchaeota archaeon]|nr:hypothetical protein [Candidatus Woesearchaeota archaeon]
MTAANATYDSIVSSVQQLAHEHDGYARSLIVYLDRRRPTVSDHKRYLRVFPDHHKVTAYSEGRHSPIFSLTPQGLYAAIIFARQGKVDSPTTIRPGEHAESCLRDISTAILRGFHSGNGQSDNGAEGAHRRRTLDERVS